MYIFCLCITILLVHTGDLFLFIRYALVYFSLFLGIQFIIKFQIGLKDLFSFFLFFLKFFFSSSAFLLDVPFCIFIWLFNLV